MNILIMPFIGALGSIFIITCFVFFTRKIHKKVEYRISNYYQVLLLGQNSNLIREKMLPLNYTFSSINCYQKLAERQKIAFQIGEKS